MMNWAEYEEEKQPRKTISPYWAIAAAILGVGLALAAAKVYGSEALIVRGQGGDWVRIFDEPCPGVPAWLKLRRAEMLYQGKQYAACWRAEDATVLIFDDNGDFSLVPAQAFQKDEGV